MRAVAISEQTGPGSARVLDLPDPSAGPGEVVVRIRAAALNHLDLWTASGDLGIPLDFPFTLGADGAGQVHEVGEGVTGFPVGARVLINPGLSCSRCERCRAGEQSECPNFRMLGEHVPGTLADYVKVPSRNVFPIPDHLSYEDAAALGTTFITAYRMLFRQGGMRPGDWVLITGIGGGLALSAFQLARPLAGKVFVTSSSPEKLHRAAAMGADEGINYKEEDFGKAIRRLTGKRGVDLVIDSAGGPTLDASLRSLRPGGTLVVAGATVGRSGEIDVRRLFWKQLRIVGSTMGSHQDVSDMLRLASGNPDVRPLVDRVFDLEDAPAALLYLATGEQFGKIVVANP